MAYRGLRGQVRSGQVRSGQVRSGHSRATPAQTQTQTSYSLIIGGYIGKYVILVGGKRSCLSAMNVNDMTHVFVSDILRRMNK